MQILNPSHHCCQHVNKPWWELHQAVSETHPSGFCYRIKCFDDTLYSQEPVIFVKEFDDDDVAQIFIDTLEKNTKDIYKKFKFPKGMIMTMHDKLFMTTLLFVTSVTRNSVKIECVIIVIWQVSLEALLMKSETLNTGFQSSSQLYFTIC